MEAIRTAPRIGIDQRCLQFVFAQKPPKRARSPPQPFRSLIRPPRGQTRRNGCACLDWLLIERVGLVANFAKAFGANGSEVSR